MGAETLRLDDGDRLRLIIEAAPNAMVMANDRGQVVMVNTEAERAFGYTREEFLAKTVEDLVPSRFRASHADDREGYFRDPQRREMGTGRDLFGLRKDGTEMPIEIGLNPIDMGDGQYVLASIIEISERIRGQEEEAARRQDRLRRAILDSFPFSIIATDPAGRILTANPAALQMLGFRAEELIGAQLTRIDAEPRGAGTDSALVLDVDVERTYRRKDGRLIPVSESVVDMSDDDGAATGFLVVAYDVSKRIEARARVEYLASHDALTNLPNRVMLMRHLERAIEVAARRGTELALLLLDLDHFKRVNDTLGHHAGDELLLRVSERLVGWIRHGDLVARLGGDEFVIVFTGLEPGADLTSRLADLRAVMGQIDVHGYQLMVTASTGAAVFPRDGSTAAQLLKNADIAMYRAKSEGRDNATWFLPEMLGAIEEKLSLSGALQRAMGEGELSVSYQPQIDLHTGALVGFEALARWQSPVFGQVPPDTFIPVAEDGGMIRELGRWVLRTACADIAALQKRLGRPLRVAVNVSPRQLRGSAWLDEVFAALEDHALEPGQLELEITESLLIADHRHATDLLTRLRDAGVRIAVDDFGRGYSSLAYLTTFPIDKLKIDRSFVQEIPEDGGPAPIVDAIIVMAHALGLEVLAEGVETAHQEEYLRLRDCDEVQGYHYGQGIPVDLVVDNVRQSAEANVFQ